MAPDPGYLGISTDDIHQLPQPLPDGALRCCIYKGLPEAPSSNKDIGLGAAANEQLAGAAYLRLEPSIDVSLVGHW